jgi:hypothetical protein
VVWPQVMIIAAACIGAVLGVFGLQAPAAADVAAAEAGPDADAEARFTRALAELKARRFHVAATEFEALWREGRSTRVLSFAAQAREGAGHWLHAIEHMRALLNATGGAGTEPALDSRLRARLTGRMTAARRHTVPLLVHLRSEEGAVAGATLTLRRVAPDELRPLLDLPIEDGRVVDVDVGVWSLTVQAPGFRATQKVFAVLPRPRRGDPVAEEVGFSLERITVPTLLALAPDEAVAAGAQWTLTLEDGPGGLRTIGGAQAREQLSLVPGRWRARVEAGGFVAQEFTWTVGQEEPPRVTLVAEAPPLVPVRAPTMPPRARDPGLGLGLGLGLTGGVSLGVGAGLLIQHRPAYAEFQRAPDNAGFVAALTNSAVGSGMIGAGLGLGIAAISAAVPVRRGGSGIKNRGLWAELGVGGAVALITAAWYSREWQRVQRDLYGQGDTGMTAPDVQAQQRETTAAAFIGAGVGLATGAGVALVTRHLVRRADRVALGGGPGIVGVGVRGRF